MLTALTGRIRGRSMSALLYLSRDHEAPAPQSGLWFLNREMTGRRTARRGCFKRTRRSLWSVPGAFRPTSEKSRSGVIRSRAFFCAPLQTSESGLPVYPSCGTESTSCPSASSKAPGHKVKNLTSYVRASDNKAETFFRSRPQSNCQDVISSCGRRPTWRPRQRGRLSAPR